MKDRNKRKKVKGSSVNPLKLDPSRTSTLRRALLAEVRKRFALLKGRIVKFVDHQDCLGLHERAARIENMVGNEEPVPHSDNHQMVPQKPAKGQSSQAVHKPEQDREGRADGEPDEDDRTKAFRSQTLNSVFLHDFHTLNWEERLSLSLMVENFNPDQQRDAYGRFGSGMVAVISSLKAAGGFVGGLEHVAKEWVADKLESNVSKLPPMTQTAVRGVFALARGGTALAFASYTAGQHVAERVAKERGMTEEQAKTFRGVMATADIAVAKPAMMLAKMAGIAAPLMVAGGFVPIASCSYLAYSTARDPLATLKAATGIVKDALKGSVGMLGKVTDKITGVRPSSYSGYPGMNANPEGHNQYTGKIAVGTKLSRDDVVDHIMSVNPPDQLIAGRMTQKEWTNRYLSNEPGGYVVVKVHPNSLQAPMEVGKKDDVARYAKMDGTTAPAIVVDSNEKVQARHGGGKLDQAYGLQSHTVIDGKHRLAAAIQRGDKEITAIVPKRKAEEIKRYSKAIELTEFAHKFANDKGHQITSIVQEPLGPRVTAKTKEGHDRTWGPSDLEKIANRTGHKLITNLQESYSEYPGMNEKHLWDHPDIDDNVYAFFVFNGSTESANLIADSLTKHGFDDQHHALLSVCLDHCNTVGEAVELAERLSAEHLAFDVQSTSNRSGFHRPENYDKIKDLPNGRELWAGANDWESGFTWAGIHEAKTAHQQSSKSNDPEKWTKINHADCPHCKGELNAYGKTGKGCFSWSKEQVDKWLHSLASYQERMADNVDAGQQRLDNADPEEKARVIAQSSKLPHVRDGMFQCVACQKRFWTKKAADDCCGTDAHTLRGLPSSQERVTDNIHDFALQTDPEKIASLRRWLEEQMEELIDDETMEQLLARFARLGFERGAGRAFDDVRGAAKGQRKLGFYEGTRDEFLRTTFGSPASVDRVKMLADRAFSDLDGVTEALAAQIQRTLMDGLVQGSNPREMARSLCSDVDDIGLVRAETIARSEIIRAHAEGQLSSMEQMGIAEVGAQVEWLATPDSRTCPQCGDMEGKVFTIEDARGIIPLHPGCRCCWLPADVGEKDDQTTPARMTTNARRWVRVAETETEETWQFNPQTTNEEQDALVEFSEAWHSGCHAQPLENVNPYHDPRTGEFTSAYESGYASPGVIIGTPEQLHAENVKHEVAKMVGGIPEEKTKDGGQSDKKPYDVKVLRKGKPADDIEVKTLMKASGNTYTMHDDALLRKHEHVERTGNNFHTVVVDEREGYSGGDYSKGFSGHRVYYKRGLGKHTLSQMHQVKSAAELHRLIRMEDDELPEKAKSRAETVSKDVLAERAAKSNSSRSKRDTARKSSPEWKEKNRMQAAARRAKDRGLKESEGVK